MFGISEIIFFGAIIGLLYFFGHNQLRTWARNIGSIKKEFKKGATDKE
jgi:Sec-independent protein translocase protein TatA